MSTMTENKYDNPLLGLVQTVADVGDVPRKRKLTPKERLLEPSTKTAKTKDEKFVIVRAPNGAQVVVSLERANRYYWDQGLERFRYTYVKLEQGSYQMWKRCYP